MAHARYQRVLLKISGEALSGRAGRGFDFGVMGEVCDAVRDCARLGVELGIVVGGGNIWRGVKDGGGKMERTRADHMGMLATALNALALSELLEQRGVAACVQTALQMPQIAEPYDRRRALGHMKEGRVVIFACGTGNPYFSTDTAAVLRASELGAEIILLAKAIDGVYSADPALHPDAKKFDAITYREVLERQLRVMDLTATSLAMENGIPVLLFALENPQNILRAIRGEQIGTIVKE